MTDQSCQSPPEASDASHPTSYPQGLERHLPPTSQGDTPTDPNLSDLTAKGSYVPASGVAGLSAPSSQNLMQAAPGPSPETTAGDLRNERSDWENSGRSDVSKYQVFGEKYPITWGKYSQYVTKTNPNGVTGKVKIGGIEGTFDAANGKLRIFLRDETNRMSYYVPNDGGDSDFTCHGGEAEESVCITRDHNGTIKEIELNPED